MRERLIRHRWRARRSQRRPDVNNGEASLNARPVIRRPARSASSPQDPLTKRHNHLNAPHHYHRARYAAFRRYAGSGAGGGLAAAGVDVVNVGVVPTPAVAQFVLARGASAGVVISASHNPFEDNGIKFFGPNGKKLPDRVEDKIATLMKILDTLPKPTGGDIGRMRETREPVAEYVERVEATLAAEASRLPV